MLPVTTDDKIPKNTEVKFPTLEKTVAFY